MRESNRLLAWWCGRGWISGGRNFSEGMNGRSVDVTVDGGQHTKSKAGEAKILRRGQRDINKPLFIDHDGLVVRRYPYSGRGVGWLWIEGAAAHVSEAGEAKIPRDGQYGNHCGLVVKRYPISWCERGSGLRCSWKYGRSGEVLESTGKRKYLVVEAVCGGSAVSLAFVK